MDDKIEKLQTPPGWDGSSDYYRRHYGLPDEIPVELPTIAEICTKEGRLNKKTKSRIRRLWRGLKGRLDPDSEEDEPVAISVENQINALITHQETLSVTPEGRAI